MTSHSHDTSPEELESVPTRRPARPMKVIVDDAGCNWLCDANVDPSGDLEQQGCWRCSDMPFNRNS